MEPGNVTFLTSSQMMPNSIDPIWGPRFFENQWSGETSRKDEGLESSATTNHVELQWFKLFRFSLDLWNRDTHRITH